MKEKKKFFIPKNYDKKFEWIPGISGWQHLAFIPVIVLDYVIIQHTPFDISNKIVMIAVSLAVPYILIGTRPTRDNVPLYKHLFWKLKFLSRQRTFKYRKEGYSYVIQEKKEGRNQDSKGSTTSKKVDSGVNTNKRNQPRVIVHTRPESGSMSEGVGS